MVSARERDNTIQLFINFRREVDNMTLPALDIKPELDSIAAKYKVAIDALEEEKVRLREAIENQKIILINTPVEEPKDKRRWYERWK